PLHVSGQPPNKQGTRQRYRPQPADQHAAQQRHNAFLDPDTVATITQPPRESPRRYTSHTQRYDGVTDTPDHYPTSIATATISTRLNTYQTAAAHMPTDPNSICAGTMT